MHIISFLIFFFSQIMSLGRRCKGGKMKLDQGKPIICSELTLGLVWAASSSRYKSKSLKNSGNSLGFSEKVFPWKVLRVIRLSFWGCTPQDSLITLDNFPGQIFPNNPEDFPMFIQYSIYWLLLAHLCSVIYSLATCSHPPQAWGVL